MTTCTRPLLIAHRGASREAPENTLTAFRLAWQEGADGIEADFRLTRDGRIVCLHDATTGRTATADMALADSTLEELRRLDFGSWKGARWQEERIPTLEEVLGQLPASKTFFIELKSGPEIIAPLGRILSRSNVSGQRLRLLAFDPELVFTLKEQIPGIRVCLNADCCRSVTGRGWYPPMTQILEDLARSCADGLSIRAHRRLDRELVMELHREGKEIHVWTVDSPPTAEHYHELGVDSIMTNRPGWLLSRLPDRVTGGEPDAAM